MPPLNPNLLAPPPSLLFNGLQTNFGIGSGIGVLEPVGLSHLSGASGGLICSEDSDPSNKEQLPQELLNF